VHELQCAFIDLQMILLTCYRTYPLYQNFVNAADCGEAACTKRWWCSCEL